MKRKQMPKVRRKQLMVAKFKSGAGAHRKSNKALRRLQKTRDCSSKEEQGAFNAKVEIS